MAPVLDTISLPSFVAFGRRHGYNIEVNRIAEDDDSDRRGTVAKGVRWQKINFIRSALEHSDVALWLDADVLICRTDADVLDSLSKSDYQGLVLHNVLLENRTNPNTGVWVMRNTKKSFDFLDKISTIGMPEGRWADQGAVLRALGWFLGDAYYKGARMPDVPTEFMQGTAWLPNGWNQPYLKKYAGPVTEPNPYAVHFMGMSASECLKHMREFSNISNIK
jgi:hypothetical protein